MLEAREGTETLVAVPGTGFGILRADPPAPRVLPEAVASRARDKHLLVLAKANSRATVHRPVHLDYVGVKKFDDDGEVVGERRFLGLFSSAAYTESVRRIPVLREKATEVIDTVGLDPMSHAGKALMDVLETYPRDELFQTPVEDLVPIASQVMYTRERRQLKLFVRRDIYGRFLSCLVYLPRDRYNTTVRERIAAILKEQLAGDRIEYTAHVGESFAARLHFVVRPAEGKQIGEPDIPDLERRCAEAARSWRDDFSSAVISTYGEEQGSRLVRTYAECFPEAYKEDYPPQTGAIDLGRLEQIEGDEGLALSLYEEIGAPPGEARLKVFRIGPPLSLSQVLPILSTTGVEVVDERPYQLEGLDRESYIYDFGLRHDQADARPRPRAVPGHRDRGVGRLQRERRLQRAGAGGRALLAPGDRAAGLREVHAPGRHPVRTGLHRGRPAQQRRHHPLPRAALRGAVRSRSARRHSRPTARPAWPSAPTSRTASPGRSTTCTASTTTGSCGPT